VTRETSAKRAPPRFRKVWLRSLPLQERPSWIVSMRSAAQASWYSCVMPWELIVGACETTSRQKKLHKSSGFGPVRNPLGE
jgi:hypothetical protein